MGYLMFEFIGVFVLLLIQVNKVMCNPFLGLRIHIPGYLEGVACDVAYLDVVRDRQLLHLCNAAVLRFIPCKKTCYYS